jgi:ribosomal protein S12 methylthiotransferase accessory factor YcaO
MNTNTGYIDLGGTIRSCSPEETLKKLLPRLKMFGISRVADVTGLDNIGIPVSVAMTPQSQVLSCTQGKGISKELARISAIMEAIEMWHAENLCGPDMLGSYATLSKKHNLLPVETFAASHFCKENSKARHYSMGLGYRIKHTGAVSYSLFDIKFIYDELA